MQWGTLVLSPYGVADRFWTDPAQWRIHFYLNCGECLEYCAVVVDQGMLRAG